MVTRHTLLTDRLCLQYYELPKLPDVEDSDDELLLWLSLFNAKTEDDLSKIEAIGGDVMKEAIDAYRAVTATDEFRQLARMRADALNIEASALGHARREAIRETEEKWQGIVDEKDTELAGKDAELADKDTELAEKDAELADKDAELAEKDAEIELLRAELQKQSESNE
ncbi:MAG: hypothetical protein FWG88_10210 [Oscillospiraceae bacterium]|nr:hypothetical protein [Oscillospiraceae bacterium]